MDAAYLKKNVMGALTEALTSMAVKIPEDDIEYVGKYLLKYVERKNTEKNEKEAMEAAEAKLADYLTAEEVNYRAAEDQQLEKSMFKTRYDKFADSLENDFQSKEVAMDALTEFIETYLDIPAAYIAVKKTVGENEILNYISAGPSQSHVKGKTLPKVVVDEGEEGAPTRQGISFEAFKLPEVPEGEEAPEEEAEEGADVPAKVPPKAQPLVVENVMRETKCKFFGPARLGSFVAVPFSYQTFEHEEGCVLGEAPPPAEVEEGQEAVQLPAEYSLVAKEAQFLVGIDTIGSYRAIKPAEIARIVALGEKMLVRFAALESAKGQAHIDYLKGDQFKLTQETVNAEFAGKFAEAEAASLAMVGAALAQEAAARAAGADPDAEAPAESELLKPCKESAAVLEEVWNAAVGTNKVAAALSALSGYLLPLPAPALNCIYAVACLVGCDPTQLQNVCGDPDWESIRKNVLEGLPAKIASYNPAAVTTGAPAANSLASVKAFAEGAGILDAAAYPPTMSVCSGALLPWLQKALAAREAAVGFHAENGTALE